MLHKNKYQPSTNNMKLITVLGTNYTIAKFGIGIMDMLKIFTSTIVQ